MPVPGNYQKAVRTPLLLETKIMLKWNDTDSCRFIYSTPTILRLSHSSSPFSDSFKIAVDMSTARGESLGKA
ncbi:hypothetical protein H5410_008367 [Solanum commersonii]|uniref:Uncharacterized protein n=1 Tax=Solanum commersonii TaxID=4109 RepID=A0A9J6AER5_SOLCO|nr:hypothetical protein H5410_008367 [Solanum commersonii]